MIVLLFVLLSPFILWNRLTWTEADENHFQQTREDYFIGNTPADLREAERHQAQEEAIAAWWNP